MYMQSYKNSIFFQLQLQFTSLFSTSLRFTQVDKDVLEYTFGNIGEHVISDVILVAHLGNYLHICKVV